MVQSWLPEPPNGLPCDEIQASDEIVVPGIDTSDTDEDEMLPFNGYEPLPLGPNEIEADHESSDEEIEINNIHTDSTIDQSLPAIVPIDRTLIHEVWNSPAPQCVDIEMDSAKANEVKMAMANFTLPSTNFPEWAANIPEDQWKEQLISRIQNLQDSKNK